MGPALQRRAFVRAGSAPSSGAGREASCLEVQRRKSLGASRIKQRMDCSLSIRANTITFFGGKNLRRCYFAQNSRLKTPTALLSLLAQVSLSARSVKCGGADVITAFSNLYYRQLPTADECFGCASLLPAEEALGRSPTQLYGFARGCRRAEQCHAWGNVLSASHHRLWADTQCLGGRGDGSPS
ncbi:uncharacterized protein LOC121110067 isoform X2 [Gallus gallus]|uniref:uncharacterized protein LOC121110067 isoform X2 n=1 Tax=Gallus gallus TaxID=9031 RepID=UPI001AE5FABB|nr:uncharacterized protein LOC121110067 isoform X2 [Gallus gallus]